MVHLWKVAFVAVTAFSVAHAVTETCLVVAANAVGATVNTQICLCLGPVTSLFTPIYLGLGLSSAGLSLTTLTSLLGAAANTCTVNLPSGTILNLNGITNPTSVAACCAAIACQAPTPYLCNGKCQASSVCASGGSRKKKRSIEGATDGVCPQGHKMCPVQNGRKITHECVDIMNNIESCGGCVDPIAEHLSVGTDCTAIPGVADVDCVLGTCMVNSCMRGFTPGINGTDCVPRSSRNNFKIQAASNVVKR